MNADFFTQALQLIQTHAWAGLGGLFCMLFVTLFTDRVKFLPTWNSPFRTTLGTLFGVAGGILGTLQVGGSNTSTVIVNLVLAAMPTLIAELLALKNGGKDGGAKVHLDTPLPGKDVGPYGSGGRAAMVGLPQTCLRWGALCALVLMLPSCAAFQRNVVPVLNETQAIIADAQEVISVVKTIEAIFFLSHPAPDSQIKVDKAIGDVELSLDGAIRALNGVTDASQEQLDAAWKDFKNSWAELRTVLHDVGIDAPEWKLGTPAGQLTIRTPLALRGGK